MIQRDKIGKSFKTFLEGVKDTVLNNIVATVRSEQLKIDKHVLERLLTVVTLSHDEGFHKGYKTFMREIDAITSVPTVPVDVPTKKK